MKKLYTSIEYKKSQRIYIRRREKQNIKRKNKKIQGGNLKKSPKEKVKDDIKEKINAPKDFRVLKNTEECLDFFKNIRLEKNISTIRSRGYVIISLKEVEEIDYSAISILTAISDDLQVKERYLMGDFPKNKDAINRIKESGFLNNMINEKGKRFQPSEQSKVLFFEKGSERFESEKISGIDEKIKKHLIGTSSYYHFIRGILAEISGNSIDWSEALDKKWLLMIKYDKDRVILTMTDVGKGIIKTLERKRKDKLINIIYNNDKEILEGAFNKKYGSKSKKPNSKSKKQNRNKGLPLMKKIFEEGKIKELKVITNNVILHFDDESKSRSMRSSSFDGTFYRWIITKQSANN